MSLRKWVLQGLQSRPLQMFVLQNYAVQNTEQWLWVIVVGCCCFTVIFVKGRLTVRIFLCLHFSKLYERFPREVNCGLLQVISPPKKFYPSFEHPQATLRDPPERVRWRSKEVVDAAYLMFYCRNMANYYVMLEDDILAMQGWVLCSFSGYWF